MLLSQHQRPIGIHYMILFLTWAGWMFDFYDLFLYSFLLIPIGRELHLNAVELSWILGLSLGTTAIGGVIFGILADRIGRKPVLLATILTYSLGTLLCGFAHSFIELLIFRSICGLGVGGEWATGQSYIAETFPPRMRGRFGAVIQTGAPVGIAFASIVGGFLEPVIGWRHCFFVSVAPALVVAAMIYVKMPESDLWLERRRRGKLPPETTAAAPAAGRPEIDTRSPAPVEFEEMSPCSTVTGSDKPAGFRGFIDLFVGPCRRMFYLALVLALLDLSAYWFTYSWLPGYLVAERGFSQGRSAVWLLITQSGGFIGYLTFGLVADVIGRRPAYSIYGVIWAAGLLMVTVLWDIVGGRTDVILACMFLVGIGTGMFGGYGPLFAEIFPTDIRNTAMGAAFNLARGVQFFTPVIIALVARRYGLAGGISLAAFFALATGAWVWLFPETKGKALGGPKLVMAH